MTPSLKVAGKVGQWLASAGEVGQWLASAGEVGQWLASADGCSAALLEAVMWPGSGTCSQSSDFTRGNVSLESDYFCPITEEKPLKGRINTPELTTLFTFTWSCYVLESPRTGPSSREFFTSSGFSYTYISENADKGYRDLWIPGSCLKEAFFYFALQFSLP